MIPFRDTVVKIFKCNFGLSLICEVPSGSITVDMSTTDHMDEQNQSSEE